MQSGRLLSSVPGFLHGSGQALPEVRRGLKVRARNLRQAATQGNQPLVGKKFDQRNRRYLPLPRGAW